MERDDEKVERLTLSVLCLHLGVFVFRDGLYPCLLSSLVMLVGGVVCRPGAVLESVASGVFPWVVSVCECCVLCLCLEVCVCKLWLERYDEVEWLTLAVLCLYVGVACGPGWFVSVSVSISCNACGRCCVSPWRGTGIWCFWCVSVGGVSP